MSRNARPDSLVRGAQLFRPEKGAPGEISGGVLAFLCVPEIRLPASAVRGGTFTGRLARVARDPLRTPYQMLDSRVFPLVASWSGTLGRNVTWALARGIAP